jgi:uncharacterized hydrophobic protein (TIGR00271 family)
MLRLESYVPKPLVDEVADALGPMPGIRHLTLGPETVDGLVLVSAELEATSADAAIDRLESLGIGSDELTLWRMPGIQPLGWRRRTRATEPDVQVWAEIVGKADENAQLAASYLIFMITAGVIAGVGVITGTAVLIVGATAISPDLLPVAAAAIGIVERRLQVTARALRALTLGLGTAALAAFAATAILRVFGRIPEDLILADTMMGQALTQLGPGSLIVAAAAGVAGMLAFERPGGAAVGVAISVTTIPAAAYVGAAMAMGRDDPMLGALGVLIANVVLLVIASTITLILQRRRRRRIRPSPQTGDV